MHPKLVYDMLNNYRCLIVLVHSLSNLTLVEEQIKKLCSQDIIKTLDESAIAKMKEPIIDFLHRLKDKHPSSTSLLFANFLFYYSSENKSFDVAHRVLNFMCDNKLKPSDVQIEKYRQSKTTKTFNLLPSKEELKEKIGMSEETYDRLKKEYISKIIKIKWNNWI